MSAAPGHPRDRLMVAIDVPGPDEAKALIETIGDAAGVFKIGLELLFSGGFALVDELAAKGHKIFLDAKLLDIETTVERATAAIAKSGAAFLTVHATDTKTLEAAVRGRGSSDLKLLGVTVLTNLGPADLKQQGIIEPAVALVPQRAQLAEEAGFDGVVCSGKEASALRERLGRDFLIVTPGIRPAGVAANDQTRAVTPEAAIKAGASYLVVGRPITKADDPRGAAEKIVEEIDAALSA
ncbi:orotidine-5'-phosphate decarboxylase [Methyloligella solikamskensis]|uniref:Orotidine 5'-phosphate decarboxylase n=1 Tax=Methyloligella solikamskensis TaxID=1177756 RepID=A0ABW3J7D7_9HYPH